MAPLITLLTDFGTRDWYVASMKGVIKGICPEAEIIDISHEITPRSIVEAAFVLSAARGSFPANTIFVCVVDPGVGTAREALLLRAHEQWFIAPNNGLLSFVGETDLLAEARALTNRHYFLTEVSNTFQGRDVFAPAAAHLARGIPALELAPEHLEPAGLPVSTPFRDETQVRGNIIYFDRFGNAITNISAAIAGPLRTEESEVVIPEIGKRIPVLATYANVEREMPLAYWGSLNYLEIAINYGNAREALGLNMLQPIILRPAQSSPFVLG